MESNSLAIKLSDSYEGFAETTGLLKLKNDSIQIQFQTKDAILGMLKSGLQEINIPLNHVEEIGYKKSIFGNKLFITVDDLRIIEGLPNSDNNKVTLGVSREDFEKAVDLVRAIRLDMSEKEYQRAMNQD